MALINGLKLQTLMSCNQVVNYTTCYVIKDILIFPKKIGKILYCIYMNFSSFELTMMVHIITSKTIINLTANNGKKIDR